MRLLDYWLSQVETLIERNEPGVPEPLFGEIAGFLGKQDSRLYDRLTRKGNVDVLGVLDALFEAEEQFLPHVVETS